MIGGERFLAEIKTTANLQHPHILSLFDSGDAEGVVYYVMPYVEGESLRDRFHRERQLPIDEAVKIATEVASALDYAHRHGVVHRDIKPENILLHDGSAMVADFGIALAVSRSEHPDAADGRAGTRGRRIRGGRGGSPLRRRLQPQRAIRQLRRASRRLRLRHARTGARIGGAQGRRELEAVSCWALAHSY